MSPAKKTTKESTPVLFDFSIDPEPLNGEVTSHAGLPVVAETFWALGGMESVERYLNGKQRERGYSDAQIGRVFSVDADCGRRMPGRFRPAAGDRGLARLMDHELPSSSKARQFLYTFHDEEILKGRPERVSRATIDADATIIESHKREALWHYKDGRGYQPHLAYWVERDLIVADQFRDGNVSAGQDPLSLVKVAFAVLPESVAELIELSRRLVQLPAGVRPRWLGVFLRGLRGVTGRVRKTAVSIPMDYGGRLFYCFVW